MRSTNKWDYRKQFSIKEQEYSASHYVSEVELRHRGSLTKWARGKRTSLTVGFELSKNEELLYRNLSERGRRYFGRLSSWEFRKRMSGLWPWSILVRPDNCMAYIGDKLEPTRLGNYLRRNFMN